MKRPRSWCAAFLLLLLASASAQAGFFYTKEGLIAKLDAQVSYRVEDSARPASFEAVSADTTGWISQKDKPFAGTVAPTSLWIRFDIPGAFKAKRLLLNVPMWEYEDFYVMREGRVVGRHKAGSAHPIAERELHVMMTPTAASGFALVELEPGKTTTVFGLLRTENRLTTADVLLVRLWDPAVVADGERRDLITQGLFYGVMFFLIVYNLGLFLVVREPSFLYYVIMEAAFALTWGTLVGLTFEYLSPNHPFWEFHYVWIGGTVGGFAAWQFLRHYLGTARSFPRVDKLLIVLAFANLPLIPLTFFFGADTLQPAMLTMVPLGAVAFVGVIFMAFKHRHPAALNLLVAMTAIGGGMSIFALVAGGVLPLNNWTMHAGQIGSALGGIILSIGLGYRLQEERTRLGRLKRFLSPKVSELIAAGQLDDPLATRRREVTIVFVDLRGFTAFSETAAPEDVLGVLRDYHAEVGRLVEKHEGTIEHFAGDAVMIIFNDPAPLPDPTLSAVSFAVELRDNVSRLAESWRRLGHQLACGLGIAQGYATIGTIGFPGRQDYGVIGAVNNLAARLCSQAAAGQVLVSQRVLARVEDKVVAEAVGELALKGLHAPVPAFNIVSMRNAEPKKVAEEQVGSPA